MPQRTTTFDRRRFMAAGLATSLSAVAPLTGPALASSQRSIRFDVLRNDSPIGEHQLWITSMPDQTIVDIAIRLKVKFAFMTLYDYSHDNREVWDSKGLLGFESETDDNGERLSVKAERQGDAILIDGTKGRYESPLDSAATTYWNRQFLTTQTWINTQDGKILRKKAESRGVERIAAAGRMIEAERFSLRGDLDLDLWYEGDDWVKLRFKGPDDSMIDYVLRSREGQTSGA